MITNPCLFWFNFSFLYIYVFSFFVSFDILLIISKLFPYIALWFFYKIILIKGAEATCVEIVTEMKKCFRLKDMLNFNIPWNF